MGREPHEVRADIEATRERLGADVDTLSAKVSPSKVAERRVDDARHAATTVREKVMGTARAVGGQVSDATDTVQDRASDTADTVRDAAGTAKDTVTAAPETVLRGAEGSPLAAGLIAFGVGALASSLIPASRPEQRAGVQVKEQAGRLAEPLLEGAQQATEQLRPKAQQAARSVRDTATDGAADIREEARDAASEVRGTATDAAGSVRQTARR